MVIEILAVVGIYHIIKSTNVSFNNRDYEVSVYRDYLIRQYNLSKIRNGLGPHLFEGPYLYWARKLATQEVRNERD